MVFHFDLGSSIIAENIAITCQHNLCMSYCSHMQFYVIVIAFIVCLIVPRFKMRRKKKKFSENLEEPNMNWPHHLEEIPRTGRL